MNKTIVDEMLNYIEYWEKEYMHESIPKYHWIKLIANLSYILLAYMFDEEEKKHD